MTNEKPTPSPRAEASRRSLWVLSALFALLFLTGGSSWPHEVGLTVLRPVAIIVAAFGIATLPRDQAKPFFPIYVVFGLLVALTASHLIPLPPSLWHTLPGREVIVEIDKLAGHADLWRPLSMAPEATLNALYALAVPGAVLFIAPQMHIDDHCRLMRVLLCLALGSCLLVVAQAGGSDIAFYSWTSKNSGVFANRNHQAALIAVMFPMLAASTYFAEREGFDSRLIRLGCALIGIGLIPLVIVTGSRMGLAASILAILMLPALRLNRKRTESRTRLQRLAPLAFMAVGASILAALTAFSARDVAISRLDNSFEDARYPVWESALRDAPNYSPWGSGVGTFSQVYQINEPSKLLGPQYFNHAHNDWLEAYYTSGWLGAALVSGVLLLAIAGVSQVWRRRGVAFALSRTGLTMLFLLALASITDYPTRTPLLAAVTAIAAIWSTAYRGISVEA